MSQPYNEQLDLDLIAAYCSARGLAAERFSDAEMQIGKTPDFHIRQNGIVVAYCEVKAPNDPGLDEVLDDAPPLTAVGGLRHDPIPNRLARLLSKADQQFTAVNSSRSGLEYSRARAGAEIEVLIQSLSNQSARHAREYLGRNVKHCFFPLAHSSRVRDAKRCAASVSNA